MGKEANRGGRHAYPTRRNVSGAEAVAMRAAPPDDWTAIMTWQHVPVALSGRRQDEIVREVWSALVEANDPPGAYGFTMPALFLMGGRLVTVNRTTAPPRIQDVTTGTLFNHINEIAEFRAGRPDKERIVGQPNWLARVMLETARPDLPRLQRIATTPFFDADGKLITRDGYHDPSGTWVSITDRIPMISPADVTPSLVEQARTFFLDELLADFPFASPADRANAVAQFVAPMVADLIDGPKMAALIEATTPGSGKTLLAKLVGIATRGAQPAMTPLDRRESEVRKTITAALAAGEGLLVFDNVAGYVDSPALAAVLSSNVWRDRILGRTEMVEIPNSTRIVLTGNNVTLSGELADRLLRIRLVPKTDRPRQRTGFKHDNIEHWLVRNRDRAVFNSAVAIANWFRLGSPYSGPVQGSFESYCRIVGGVLEAAGIDGFLGNRDEFTTASATSETEWRSLCDTWWSRFGEHKVTASQLNLVCDELGILGSLRASGQPAAVLSRKISSTMRERVFDGRMICVEGTGVGHANRFFLKPIQDTNRLSNATHC